MGKVKEEINREEYYKEIHFLYEILNSLKNLDEVKAFFKDMLTHSELVMLKRRWHIATLLFEGMDVRTAALTSRTSTNTVSRIKKVLEEGFGGLSLALKRAKGRGKAEKQKYINSKKQKGGSTFVKGWFK